jgi:hypothetical protein
VTTLISTRNRALFHYECCCNPDKIKPLSVDLGLDYRGVIDSRCRSRVSRMPGMLCGMLMIIKIGKP